MYITPSLDVHIATIESVPKKLIEECIESVIIAANNSNYDVKIHVFEGIQDHIGNTRNTGYALGNNRYCTNVDCDDYILSNAFSILEESLSHNYAMISTGEIQLQNGNFTNLPLSQFHLKIYRRDLLENIKYSDHPLDIDVIIKKMIAEHPDGLINITECVYVHRLYWNSGSRVLARKLYKMNNNHG